MCRSVSADGAQIIGRLFADSEPKLRHVVITGPLNSGKTSLAVGTATEFAFHVRQGRFISLVKLLQTGSASGTAKAPRRGIHPETTFQEGRTIWPLEAVDNSSSTMSTAGFHSCNLNPSASRGRFSRGRAWSFLTD